MKNKGSVSGPVFYFLSILPYMQPSLIKLIYQQLIDGESDSPFEQAVFHDSYEEFVVHYMAPNVPVIIQVGQY